MDSQNCNNKVTQKRPVEDDTTEGRKKLKTAPSSKILVDKYIIRELLDTYKVIQENFLRYNLLHKDLLADVRKEFPGDLDLHSLHESLQIDLNSEEDSEIRSDRSKPLVNMEVVLEMMILKETFLKLADSFNKVSMNVQQEKEVVLEMMILKETFLKLADSFNKVSMNVQQEKVFLEQLMKQEESYGKLFDVFKRNIEHVCPTQTGLIAKRSYYTKKLLNDLLVMRSRREELEISWRKKNLNSIPATQLEATEEIILSNSNAQQHVTVSTNCDKQDSYSSGMFAVDELLSPLVNSLSSNEIAQPNSDHSDDIFKLLEEGENVVKAKKKHDESWPESSLPVLDDLTSSPQGPCITRYNEGYGSCTSTPKGTNSVETENRKISSNTISQEIDRFIMENKITEVGSYVGSQDLTDDHDLGNHFLVPETTLTTGMNEICSSTPRFNIISQEPNVKQLKPSLKSPIIWQCCNEVFPNNKTLNKHLNLTHTPKLCTQCGEIFPNAKKLSLHTDEHHKSHKMCMSCGEVQEKINFTAHLTSHSKVIVKVKERFKCIACPKSFKDEKTLNVHQKTHQNSHYTCNFCEHFSYTKYESLKHNMEHLSERLRKHSCKVCFSFFDANDKLIKHLKYSHFLNENRCPDKIQCVICDFTFESANTLIHHMREAHHNDSLVVAAAKGDETGRNCDQCTVCQMYFKQSKVRAVHTIIFHETAPYKCRCTAQFYTKAMFDFHQLNHTKSEESNLQKKSR